MIKQTSTPKLNWLICLMMVLSSMVVIQFSGRTAFLFLQIIFCGLMLLNRKSVSFFSWPLVNLIFIELIVCAVSACIGDMRYSYKKAAVFMTVYALILYFTAAYLYDMIKKDPKTLPAFIRGIRNMIASPGHCLIRKAAIPEVWQENPMKINGSDDYYLWLLMFARGAVFKQNATPVYIHRNSESGNLSFDLEKIHRSNEEMCALLDSAATYPATKLKTVRRSILFKYLYDTKQLKALDWFRFGDKILANGLYRTTLLCLKHCH